MPASNLDINKNKSISSNIVIIIIAKTSSNIKRLDGDDNSDDDNDDDDDDDVKDRVSQPDPANGILRWKTLSTHA